LTDELERIKTDYRGYIRRKLLFIAACCAAAVVIGGVSCTIGGREIGFFHVFEIIWDHILGATFVPGSSEWWDDYIVFNIRLPRVVMTVIAGVSLALCGVAMQSVMANPLADPFTTGISSGACFGAVAAIVMGLTFTSAMGQYGIITNAFIGGMVPAMIIIMIAQRYRASPATLILAGIAISYFFNAMSTFILVSTDADTLRAAYVWQIGSLESATWSDLPIMLAITVAGSLFLQYTSAKLNILTLGDESAKSLGLDASKYRMVCLVIIALMASSIISYTGIIGFIGLVAPHIVRIVLGSDNKFLIPASMAFGSAFLLLADLIGRTIVAPGELPVGLIMSFIGGPLFLYLIIRQKKGYGEIY